ncbi:MAG TPA: hypothetical protein VGM14_04670 [Streptosporangiaceae bacterium]
MKAAAGGSAARRAATAAERWAAVGFPAMAACCVPAGPLAAVVLGHRGPAPDDPGLAGLERAGAAAVGWAAADSAAREASS